MTWYKSGTVSVIQNSNAVIGMSTAFIANSRVGDAFRGPDGGWYEVTNIASDTALSISPNYQGSTDAAGSYALAPMQGYVKDTADALRQASLQVGGALDGLEESVLAAEGSAAAALVSKSAAAGSEVNASASAASALASKNAAGVSEANSGASADGALASKNAAATSETNAGTSAAAALISKNAAAISEANAAASAGTAASLGVGRGYIDGLTLSWGSATSIIIGAGSAYVPSVNKVVSCVGGTIVPSGSATTFIHVYLTAAGDIEQSATAPARYSNQAHQKTGDDTRRYIGSLLVGAANNIYKFHHHPVNSSMMYTHGNAEAVPFKILSAATGIGNVSCRGCCPVTAHTLVGGFQSVGSGACMFTPTDAGTSIGSTGWQVWTGPTSMANSFCRIADDGTVTYRAISPSTASIYATGYYFDR